MKKNKYRDIYCGKVTEEFIDKKIKISGWVENIRDHGGVLFLDLRDMYGTLQLVSNENKIFDGITKESVISVEGIIRKRDEETINESLSTGTIELLVESLELLSKAKNELPFEIITSTSNNESIRLKYRYLDLRNKEVRDNILFRSEVIKYIREKMYNLDFIEFQTPILTASSPEGARDFVVPSRKHKGKFYALPQAPQIFKQLIMVSGFDRYFQIAPCFRDEDGRSDRTPGEFYQLDLEMAFVEQEDVLEIGEEIFYDIFSNFGKKHVSSRPFTRITYRDSILKYGTDKPDLRNPLEIIDLTEDFANTTFKPFAGATVRGIVVHEIGNKSNAWFNELVDYSTTIGMPGIGYVTLLSDGTLKGPIDKFLSDDERKKLIEKCAMKTDSVLFFIADRKETMASKYSGLIRNELGKKLELIDNNKFEICIVNDFPMFEFDEEIDKYVFSHNPFSMPQGKLDSLVNKKPEDILAYQYDFVCNGVEIASGAVRNHDLNIMKKAFEITGYNEDVIKEKFTSLYTAFQYGAPPHAGMAPGIDRIIMLLKDEPNIREVILFPMNSNAQDLMMNAPSFVTEQQLREVHIKIRD
ncbi:MAG: aspartate--tRNA ligase [Bacilli bacterium]|nr:aspartate--tRNA ligase [Bacilli bacterium]MDD4718833.1 aspartate--tRNA ligase [Bacilli bacterium]